MDKPVKLACRHVWKLFGAVGPDFLAGATEQAPTLEMIQDAGLVGAVRDANLEILEGEIFVIMGLSGSGKSTLVRCLSRLIEPTAGELIFEGIDLLKASAKEMIEIRRHKMGMVFQHFALLPHLTVLENVAFPLEVQGKSRSQREQIAREVIELVGLKGREDNFPRELSGGQQQRVGIARSLAVEPELWFLDEPFSALDPLIRREMQDEFLRLQSLLHKTIVFITHDFEEAVRLADRIAIMKDGQVIQVATPEQLVLNPENDYVKEFTKHIPRSKVLSAGAVMSEQKIGSSHQVFADERIEKIAEKVVTTNETFSVLSSEGNVVGSITPQQVINVLVGRSDDQ
ncbi:quaternary amine ABC transporter ATP-binding protein [Sneathiella glossodoripedis]|uniref:quaternary amine ABC transporter ATP-binding protein n=1 Tax=Sneathiella glossodoripedis TaxID=418853 RepID=UPI0004720809|nr:betaine/proline/choline family ABC transporter ATP-binding protein [Sneathiella glossodoripedis]